MIVRKNAHIKSDNQTYRRWFVRELIAAPRMVTAQSVGELTARLAKATGREAIRLGTALTKARRAMNGG